MDGVYLGVDVGTSATRVSLVRPGGHALVVSAGYRTVRAGHGRVEQDPAAWSRALAAALRRSGADLREVTAVGLCGQTPTLVPVDAAGRPVRAALTWQDTRAAAEAAELADRFGDPEPLIGTALPGRPRTSRPSWPGWPGTSRTRCGARGGCCSPRTSSVCG